MCFESCNVSERRVFLTKSTCITGDISTDSLSSVKVIDSDTLVLSVDDILLFNNQIILECLEQSANVFSLYDLNGVEVSAFGKIGRAENEFSDGAGICGQNDSGNIIVNDVNLAAIKYVDIQASVESGQCVVSEKYPTSQRVINVSVIDDSLMVYEQEILDNYELVVKSLDDRLIDKEIILYQASPNPFMRYRSFMKVNGDKSMVALAMSRMNQVNFLSLESGKRFAYSLYKNPEYPSKIDAKKMVYYCDITASDKYVYVLYMNQTHDESYEVEKPMEIHVFDWDGSFVKRICVNESICRLSASPDDKILVASDKKDNVFKYYLE